MNGVWEPATDCHHVTPHRGNRLVFNTSELRALCHSCHSKHTGQERVSAAGEGEGA